MHVEVAGKFRFFLSKMEISLKCLQTFIFGLEQVPPETPRRWELIAELVSKLSSTQGTVEDADHETEPQDLIGVGIPHCGFVSSAKCCKNLFSLLLSGGGGWCRSDILSHVWMIYGEDGFSSLKPLVLMPSMMECCSTRIRVDPRPSYPLVYTLDRWYISSGNVSWAVQKV